jgi:hypothetical protein
MEQCSKAESTNTKRCNPSLDFQATECTITRRGFRSALRAHAQGAMVPPGDVHRARREPTLRQVPLNLGEGSVDSVVGVVRTQCQGFGEGFPSAQPTGGTGYPARSAEPANSIADSGRGSGETSLAESPIAYILRRIREITSVDAPLPL